MTIDQYPRENGGEFIPPDAYRLEDIALGALTRVKKEEQQWFPLPYEGEVNFDSRIDVGAIQMTDQYVGTLDKYLDKALDDFTGFSQEKCDGFAVALSGGIDSAVVARLLQDYSTRKGRDLKTIIIGQGDPNVPVEAYPGTAAEWMDIQFARHMCADLGLPYEYIDIKDEYELARQHYSTAWAKSSQLPRIRANHLYTTATENDLISVGSTNGSEFILTAFSTGGPAGDIAPLIDLYKTEVYAIARDIGVPDYIRQRKPLVSEMNIDDYALYGGNGIDSTLMDPILRRLWYKEQTPRKVARELGHSERWIQDIVDKRIEGESSRRGYNSFIINRPIAFKRIRPNLKINRSYFP